jgi:glycerophosphoryl diester phosphodiesterase
MENKLKEAKKTYDSIQIPEELDEMINKTINENQNKKVTLKRAKFKRLIATSAAAFAICSVLTVGLNTSEAFANSASDIPIIGNIARLLTFTEFEFKSEVITADIRIPEIKYLEDKKLEKKINIGIYIEMKKCLVESEQRALEYKEAFISTGGTEESFRPIVVTMDYELKSVNKDTLSFTIFHYESLASAYSATTFYNIDLKTEKIITLKNIYGDEFMDTINNSIKTQIDLENSKSETIIYTDFKGISENQNFYINEDGQTVIVFDKYAITAGYMGMPEFIID